MEKQDSIDALGNIKSQALKTSIIAVLTSALAALDNGKKWGKGLFAADEDGCVVSDVNPEEYKNACKFCAIGAVYVANPTGLSYSMLNIFNAGFEDVGYAERALYAALPDGFGSVTTYNDEPWRAFGDIEALYKRAIKLVEDIEIPAEEAQVVRA